MNVYDFDGTIYDGDSTVDFFIYALRRTPSLLRFAPKQAWGFLLYGMKRITKTELKETFFSFLAGVDARELLKGFWEQNRHKIYKWYPKQQRPDDIIISASPEFLLEPICQSLGIQHLIASRVDPQSGRFMGENCHGAEKVRRLAAQYQVERIDHFYSDSQSDLPLARISAHAHLVVDGRITNWNPR